MGEHNQRDRPQRFMIPEKPKHPLGWNCSNCFHVVKDSSPGSAALKCVRYPPEVHIMQQGMMSVYPPTTDGEWCGEFSPVPPAANG